MIRRKVRRKTAKVRRKWHKFVEKFVENGTRVRRKRKYECIWTKDKTA